MRRLFRWLIGLPVLIIVMGFAVANRQWTQLSLDPFHEADPRIFLALPLWLLLFVGIFIGVFTGWFFCWLAQGKYRRLSRERAREITKLNTELAEARQGPQRIETQMLAPLPGIMP